MTDSIKVLFAAAEASPLVKLGGLGDVVGTLPKVLRQAGYDVRIILPKYGFINLEGHDATSVGHLTLPFMGTNEEIWVYYMHLQNGTPVYLVDNKTYLDRKAIYGEEDDSKRFLLFSLAVMETLKIVNWKPDILHCHDWHSGVVPALLKVAYRTDPFYAQCASVFTIHNLAYQGWFDDSFVTSAGLQEYMPPYDDPLRGKTYSMAGLGIYHSDMISTVSDKYAKEILTQEYGVGIEELLQKRRDSLIGIINGIDYEVFDPATDRIILANYDANSIEKRVANKLALQAKAGLAVNSEIPLIGMVGRLVEQKGIDIMVEALESLLAERDVQFVLQGIGDTRYHEILEMLQSQHPDKAHMFLTLDFALARLLFAGCDIILSPSRFEPCGLTPLIALHYGAIPIARYTGGMAQNIMDFSTDPQSGLGFIFEKYDADDLLMAIRRALTALRNKDDWQRLVARAMKADYSWNPSLPKYEALYEIARSKTRG